MPLLTRCVRMLPLFSGVSSYLVPYGTYMRADCLVLNSTQTVLAEGFQREPLYRAEVYVYVFNTTYPECCCKDTLGKERCAEWEVRLNTYPHACTSAHI